MAIGTAEAIIYIRAVDLLSKPLTGMAGTMARIGATISQVGLALSAGLTAPIIGAGIAITKTSIEFDRSMRNIQSISRDTDEATRALADRFRALSIDITKTVASPLELAEAFYEIQSAAFYGAEAQKILEQVTKTATAGLADQVAVAKAVATALHAYGVGAEEVVHFTDVMMRAVDVGIFRFEDLTQQMGDFIAAAGMMKVPIEDVFAAMSTMTKRGLQAAEAATSLNRILMTYLKPSDAATAAAAEFGITLSASTLKALGFAGAMEQVYKATGGSEDALAAIFRDVRAVRGVFALASDGLELFNTDLNLMTDAAGTVDQVFATQVRSWAAQLQNLRNRALDLAISFGEVLIPILIDFAERLGVLIAQFKSLPLPTREAIVKFALLAAVVGPLLIIIGQVIATFGALVGILFSYPGLILAIVTPIALLATAFSDWQKNTFGLRDTLEGLSEQAGKLGGVAAAIVAVFKALEGAGFGESIVDWGSAFGTAQTQGTTFAKVAGEAIKQVTIGAIEFKGTIENLAFAFSFVVEAAKVFFEYLWRQLQTAILMVNLFIGAVTAAAKALDALSRRDFATAIEVGAAASSLLNRALDESAKFLTNTGSAIDDVSRQFDYYKEAIEQINVATKDQQAAIEDLDLSRIIDQHIELVGISERAALLEANRLAAAKRGLIKHGEDQAKVTKKVVTGFQEQSDAAKKARNAIVSAFGDMLQAGERWAAKLAPKTAQGLDIFDPHNPSSPFQPFYRILDVAERWKPGGTPGSETAKWAEMYFPGMPQQQQWENAMRISGKLLRGMWDEELQSIFGPEGIKALATEKNLQDIGNALRTMFAGAIANYAGTPEAQQAALSIAGLDSTTISKLRESGKIQTATDGLFTVLLPAFDKSLTNNATTLENRGAEVWGRLESGMIKQAETSGALYKAVESMVGAILNRELGP